MTTETWYAFQDPKTKREYYFDPVSNKTTWTLPSSSGTPVKIADGARPGIIPASPMSITGDMIPPTPSGVKIKKEKNQQTKADGSSNKSGFGRRGVAVAVGSIMVLNTLCLGILVKVMYNSSIVNVDPISDSKVVPPVDNVRVEPVDVGSDEIAEEVAPPEDNDNTHHDVHEDIDNTETAPVAAGEEVKEIDSNPVQDDNVEEERISENEDYIEKEAIVSDNSSSSDNEDGVEEEAVLSDSSNNEEDVEAEAIASDSSLPSDDEDYIAEGAVVSDGSSSSDDNISKRLTRKKLLSIITPVVPIIVGVGAARIAVALIARVALILSPPAAPVVVAEAVGPMSIIKAFFERFLGGPNPAAIVVKDPTLLEKIANMFANLMKMK